MGADREAVGREPRDPAIGVPGAGLVVLVGDLAESRDDPARERDGVPGARGLGHDERAGIGDATGEGLGWTHTSHVAPAASALPEHWSANTV